MESFERNLINTLLDKYENSKLSKGNIKVNKEIKLKTSDVCLSSYTSFDSYKHSDYNDLVIKKLESLGFITAKFEEDTFKYLTLNINNVDELYKYIKRDNPKDELNRIKEVLNKYTFNNFLDNFINYVNNYIDEKKEFPKIYFNDSKQLDLLLNIFSFMFSLKENIKKRDFSSKYLKDSKLFEANETKIIKIIKNFDCNQYTSDSDILAEYHIIKNSSYALVKNKLILEINKSIINLDDLGFEMSLSDEMILNLKIIKTNIDKVITVENLTSFYSLNDKDALIIYLAGFHNHTKQMLLEKIYKIYPNAVYYHFSDIDVGGFLIYNNLKSKTKIPFIPYRMNKEELENNKNNLKPLTLNDIKRLNELKNQDEFMIFNDTINYMLEQNCKLEQELLD